MDSSSTTTTTLPPSEDSTLSSDSTPLPPPPPPPPTASLSLSLSSFLSPSHLLPKPPLSPLPTTIRIPSQISSLATLSLSSTLSNPPSRSRSRSSSSSLPLHSTLLHLPRRPSDPSHPAALRRCTLVWLRNDLRVHDNEALTSASNDSVSVLPVYLFDPRDYGKSSSGFDRTGPYRARFLLESVSDLRKNLRNRGSDLVVRIGRPEVVLVEVAREVGADAVYAHQEVSNEEVKTEERVGKAMEAEGVEVKYFWGSTLYHVEDLPFDVEQMPSNYGGFRERVQGLAVRKTIQALDQMKGLPSRGDIEVGELPSLLDLGLNPPPPMDGKPAANASLVGGESEALSRLKRFASECRAQPNKDNNKDSIYGANFSCKISPWLAMGCLSPRFMFDELKKSASRTIAASTHKKGGNSDDNGMNWLMFELLWRDFFRFITKKYSTSKRKTDAVPATACTGAFA